MIVFINRYSAQIRYLSPISYMQTGEAVGKVGK